MTTTLRALCAAMTATLLHIHVAHAAMSDNVIRIGVLNDRSGAYADLGGEGSVVAAKMAAEEFGNAIGGVPVEIVSADHQNKPDIGLGIVRRWFDTEKVDAVADISNSGVGFAVTALAKERNKIVLNASASSDFTGKACTRTSFQWVYTSYTNGYGLARALTAQKLDSWFLITVDYSFGHAFATDMRRAVENGGGKVIGEVRHPLNTADFSSVLLQAQASGAKVIALANAGADMTNSVKQAAEFGITRGQALVAPTVFLTDVDAMGLAAAQNLQFVTAYYWDRDAESRVWADKFFEKVGRMPTMTQAGVYSAVRHYLRAVQAANSDDGLAVAAKIRELPVADSFARGTIRTDGQFVHDMYLARVKTPAASSRRWDYYDIVATIPAEQAFRPLGEGGCELVSQ
ncbi:ABC transporter substrate-binding protein [Bradyrhizobium sp. AUGA SZCCT0124]|uniref:ABC transporter substrate-binding protein n=1 Tax=unclassified Bradyrhizobium TaxID=2631580 RepID=UPI001BAA9DDA|nr:ABC transporter substrate-binding protein [Bradyrhizobium sp. AUGA SZCCT0124]MBR1317212.1 ABC transporter substrate-binding protein [Bradyrhizobium sp. AUGA SZCCT0051]MBR1345631.1 ABC transporter substrate-binding protein [Bradyrhizobium sp. AUGA SZCCT0105]MBR1360370.1 ABC transporter substrate-binding protein [Bradyrhizobium sp. AUGA SZCCT0045]